MGDTATLGAPLTVSAIAGAAVEEGDIVEIDTTNDYPKFKKTSGDTVGAAGYALSAAAADETFAMVPLGPICSCRSSASITEGGFICPAADGEIQDCASGDQACGIAFEAASDADEDVMCMLGFGWLKA